MSQPRHQRKMPAALLLVLMLVAAVPLRAVPAAAATSGLTQAFSDISGDVNEADLNLLGALRLMIGDQGLGGPARPGDALTRAEFAALALRIGGLADEVATTGEQPPIFADAASIPMWAWRYVNAAVAHGLVTGYEDGTLRPAAPVRLAEGLAILARMLGRADEVDPQLAWPESYLELAARIGLAGRYAGLGDDVINRSAIAHLAAQALALEQDETGSRRNLLTSRYGHQRALLEGVTADGFLTSAGRIAIADPHFWADAQPSSLIGKMIEWLSLPGSDLAAIIAPDGSAAWSPAFAAAYLSSTPSALATGSVAAWHEAVSLVQAAAPAASQAGALTSSRVRLASPTSSGMLFPGCFVLAGTTSAGSLMLRYLDSNQAWIPVGVSGGSFRQVIHLTEGRRSHRMQLLVPAPEPGYFYPDLTFTVQSSMSLVGDARAGTGFTTPRTSLVEAAGFVDVAGFVPGGTAYLQVQLGEKYTIVPAPTTGGMFDARIWLTQGLGDYSVRICVDAGQGGHYLLTDSVITVRNRTADPAEYAAPGLYVESGHAAVRSLAETVTSSAIGDYAQARAIYDWVTRSIAYDVARAGDPGAAALGTREILARGRGVCEDYANVFAALCRAVGVPARIALGLIEGRTMLHAWNEVLVDGRWVSLDPTWGAGYVRGSTFYSSPTDAWFDRDLSATHFREGIRTDWFSAGGDGAR